MPYFVQQATKGVYIVDLSSTVRERARSHQVATLGTLDALHLATADPFRTELTELVTYDSELAAATELGFPVTAPT